MFVKMLSKLTLVFFLMATTIGVAVAGTVTLKPGLNLITFPVDFDPPITSHQIDQIVGKSITSLGRLNTDTNEIETTVFSGGSASGPDFPIRSGEGYLLQIPEDNAFEIDGSPDPIPVDLVAGVNIVGFHPVRPGFTAYQLLTLVSEAGGVAASLTRFDRRTGRYETSTRDNGQFVGKDFPLKSRESYMLSMYEPLDGFTMPGLPFIRSSDRSLVILDAAGVGGGRSISSRFIMQGVAGQPIATNNASSETNTVRGGLYSVFTP